MDFSTLEETLQDVGLAHSDLAGVAAFGVKQMMFVGDMLLMLLEKSDSCLLTVYNLVTSSKHQCQMLPADSQLVHNVDIESPCYIRTGGDLYVLALDTTQENLVTRLMTCETVSMADRLCLLNHWDQCTIPLHALVAGIKHRQLDTIAFFLKTRQNVLTLHSEAEMKQIYQALELLTGCIRDCKAEPQSMQFGDHLLGLTVQFINKLIHAAAAKLQDTPVTDPNKKTLTAILSTLSNHRLALRQYHTSDHLSQGNKKAKTTSKTEESQTLPLQMRRAWDSMSVQEVIQEGLGQADLAALQIYLVQRFGKMAGSFKSLQRHSLNQSLTLLKDGDLDAATTLLTNMGFSSDEKLLQLLAYSPDRQLRDFIAQHLASRGLLTDSQRAALTFLHQLQSIYSCPSFNLSKMLRNSRCLDDPLQLGPLFDHNPCLLDFGEVSDSDITNSETACYSQVLLKWTEHWSHDTKHRILLEQILSGRDVGLSVTIPAHSAATYLLSHLEQDKLGEWMNKGPNSKEHVKWPYNQQVPESLLQASLQLSYYWRNKLQTCLVRAGLHTQKRLGFPEMFQMLSRCQETIGDADAGSDENKTWFTQQLIKYCIEHELLAVLHLITHRLEINEQEQVLTWGEQQPEASLLTLVQCFHRVAKQPSEKELMLEASLVSSACISGLSVPSVSSLIQHGHLVQGLATSLYSPYTTQQVWHGEVQDERLGDLSCQSVQDQLKRLPFVYQALTRDDGSSPALISPTLEQLQDELVFKLRKGDQIGQARDKGILGSTNEGQHVLELDVSTYLQQHRPSQAVLAFLLHQFQSSQGGPGKTREKKIYGLAQSLALQNFHNMSVSTACCAFLEMLGQSSFETRLLIQTGHVILAYKLADYTGRLQDRRKAEAQQQPLIGQLLAGCRKQRLKIQQDTLELLKSATMWEIERDKLQKCSIEAAERWQLALTFSYYFGLPPPTLILESCAKEDRWVEFLLIAYGFNFQQPQVLEAASSFKNVALREHLQYVIKKAGRMQEKGLSRMRAKDPRKQLYQRIGLQQHQAGQAEVEETGSKEETATQSDSTSISEELDLDLPLGSSLMEVLLNCVHREQGWWLLCGQSLTCHNPILAVLGACCQDADMIHCLCCWLLATLHETAAVLPSAPSVFSASELHHLITRCLQQADIHLVLMGFKLFIPNQLLVPFLECCNCLDKQDPADIARSHLENFKSLWQQQNASDCNEELEEGDECTGLNGEWVQAVVRDVLTQLLTQPRSYTCVSQLLQLLHITDMTQLLHSPDFSQLHQLHEIGYACDIQLNYSELLQGGQALVAACQGVLHTLQEARQFREARLFAEVAGIPSAHITFAEIDHDADTLQQHPVSAHLTFWQRAQEKLRRYRVEPQLVVAFFKDKAGSSSSPLEAACLYKLAYQWLNSHPDREADRQELYVRMWCSRVQAHLHNKQSGNGNDKDYILDCGEQQDMVKQEKKREFLTCDSDSSKECPIQLTVEEKKALEELLIELLLQGQIKEAGRLTGVFGISSIDYASVQWCIRLATGVATVRDIDPAVVQHIRKTKDRPHLLRRQMSSRSLLGDLDAEEEEEELEEQLKLLSQHCPNASFTCWAVYIFYHVAKVLGQTYEWVCCQADFDLLHQILNSANQARYQLAKDFIHVCGLSDAQVCGFLSNSILQILQRIHTVKDQGSRSMSGSAGELGIHPELISLCQDPAVLGQRLLESSQCYNVTKLDLSQANTGLEVELLVYTHSCFTKACSMEGITRVLKCCQICATGLAQAEKYTLMVKLLTGVGRYGEMPYIFDILKQQHQFQLLLRPSIDKDGKLKLAVLDYLQRYHRSDTDTYTMASVKFAMYRDIAVLLEAEAVKTLKVFTGNKLENSSENQSQLQAALQFYSDAVENYIKAECLRQAESCVKQAKLVGLQLQHLTSAVKLVNLDQKTSLQTFLNQSIFWEGYIVADAYKLHGEWAAALYRRVIVKGDAKYLHDYLQHLQLSPGVLADIVTRYRSEGTDQQTAARGMKKLLECCEDAQQAYSMAMELGWSSWAQQLTTGINGAYLRDQLTL